MAFQLVWLALWASRSAFPIRADNLEPFFNIDIFVENSNNGRASITFLALLHVPDWGLCQEGQADQKESRDDDSHHRCKAKTPFAIDLLKHHIP